MAYGITPFGAEPFGSLPETGTSYVVLHGRATLSVSFEYAIHVASHEFITDDDDTPADTPFYGALDQPLSFRRSIVRTEGFGGLIVGQGELVIQNSSGDYDFMPQYYALDGRNLEVKFGRPGDNYANWFTVFRGTASDYHVDETEFRVDLQDYGYKLEVALNTNTYAGTGGVNGGADLEGKRKPLCYGYCLNLTPVLVKANSQLYQVHDGSVQAISGVYANGVALTYDQDYATSAELLSATVPEGYYATCLAMGLFRIDFLLDGDVITCDVEGDDSGTGFVSTQASIVRRIVGTKTVLVDPTDFYLPSFSIMDAASGYDIGYYADHNNDQTVSEAIATIIGFSGVVGFRRNGKIEVCLFMAPADPPHMYLDRTEIIDIRRERLPDGLTPPPYRWRVGYGRNWTVQDEIAGSVSDARRAFLTEEVRYATAESLSVKVNHEFAQEPDAVGGFYRNKADAQAVADRLLDLYSATASLYRVVLGLRAYRLEIGSVVHVTFPRFDLTNGRLLRVVEVSENAQSGQIEILGFG